MTTTTSKPLLLIYGDGALKVAHHVQPSDDPVYRETVYLGPPSLGEDPVGETSAALLTRTFVLRAETKQYRIYEEWS